MLKKSYPMRYHEERPFSADQLYPDKDHCVPDPEEPGERRSIPNKRERPVQVVLVGPNEQAAQQDSATSSDTQPESSENENLYPTAFAMHSNWPPDHHRRHCTVCNHPWRSAIEEEFLHWASPDAISHHYSVGWRSVYRHAHALGLFEQRGRNLRSALGNIIEHSNHVAPAADTVVRAIRAYACVNKSGKWLEPTKHVAFSSVDSTARSRAIDDLRQGTASAVPSNVQHPGVLTPEVGRRLSRSAYKIGSARSSRKKRKSEALPGTSPIDLTAESTGPSDSRS